MAVSMLMFVLVGMFMAVPMLMFVLMGMNMAVSYTHLCSTKRSTYSLAG